MSREQIQKAT